MKDYSRDLFQQNQELTGEVERLREESRALRSYKTLASELQERLTILGNH